MTEDMTQITLERSGLRPLRFRGRAVWRWETSPDRTHPHYSGEIGHWTVLVLYQVAGADRYVLHEQRLTNWDGERDHLATHQFATLEEVADWLEANAPGAVGAFCTRFNLYEELGNEAGEESEHA